MDVILFFEETDTSTKVYINLVNSKNYTLIAAVNFRAVSRIMIFSAD